MRGVIFAHEGGREADKHHEKGVTQLTEPSKTKLVDASLKVNFATLMLLPLEPTTIVPELAFVWMTCPPPSPCAMMSAAAVFGIEYDPGPAYDKASRSITKLTVPVSLPPWKTQTLPAWLALQCVTT